MWEELKKEINKELENFDNENIDMTTSTLLFYNIEDVYKLVPLMSYFTIPQEMEEIDQFLEHICLFQFQPEWSQVAGQLCSHFFHNDKEYRLFQCHDNGLGEIPLQSNFPSKDYNNFHENNVYIDLDDTRLFDDKYRNLHLKDNFLVHLQTNKPLKNKKEKTRKARRRHKKKKGLNKGKGLLLINKDT
jgi:hypothetical protein